MNKRYVAMILAGLSAIAAQAANKPNILWIVTDDQRADSLACFNQATMWEDDSRLGFVYSPNIDTMASNGVLFTEAYCNSPVCGPSRASMQTGCYPHHNGRYAFEHSHMKSDVSRPIVAQLMQEQGYSTAAFGKLGHLIAGAHYETEVDDGDLVKNGYTDFSKSNKRKPGIWGPAGVIYSQDTFHGPDGNEPIFFEKAGGLSPEEQAKKERVEKKYDILRAYKRELSSLILGGVSPQPPEKTLDGEILNAFNAYLDHPDADYQTGWGDAKKGPASSKPLFAYVGFHFPHTPVLPPKQFRDLFADKVYKLPDFSKAEMKRMPEWVRNLCIKMNFVDMTPEDQQQAIRDYYAFCAFGDDLVGQAVDRFKRHSEKQGREWLIVYVVGDHGWHLGEQGIESKFAPWRTSTRGAVIVEASNKKLWPAGKVCKKHVEYVDFVTTFYRAAGLDDAKAEYPYLDGVPLDDTLHNRVAERSYGWVELNQVTGPWASLRTKEFMFGMKTRPFYNYPPDYKPNERVRWALDAPLEKVQPVLYDLRVDADERINLARVPEYRRLVEWFRGKVGNIALGDGRVEVNWKADNEYNVSNFAPGADDKRLDIPEGVVPDGKQARKVYCREYYQTLIKE